MPASPPPTSSHSSRSTPSQRPAATGCSPRRPAAPAPTGPSSPRSSTSSGPGDTLVVWKLDRLGRSLKHLIETVTALQARKVGFRSLQESIDTTTSGGKLIFHVFGALAEFERDLIRERTQAGLQAARARGRKGGRPRSLDARKLAQARSLHRDPANTIAAICATLGISRATFYRHLDSPAEEAGVDGHREESHRAERRSAKRSRPGRPRAKGAR
jgi:DNA invertase Pin-like site-specific DNA recombinase